jgi:GNAT superfamily N-acetyltransferase
MSSAQTRPVTVRALESRDRPRWDELWKGYLAFYQQELPQAVTEHTWRRLIDPAEGLHGYVAVDDQDRAIGIVHFHFHASTWSLTSYCYLEDLFVDPQSRAKGTGRALIAAVYRAADERGASRVYWHTENTNGRAQALYHQVAELTPFVQFRRTPPFV